MVERSKRFPKVSQPLNKFKKIFCKKANRRTESTQGQLCKVVDRNRFTIGPFYILPEFRIEVRDFCGQKCTFL